MQRTSCSLLYLKTNTLTIHYDEVVLNYNYGTRNKPYQFSD